jgi:hypothetical protein
VSEAEATKNALLLILIQVITNLAPIKVLFIAEESGEASRDRNINLSRLAILNESLVDEL